MNDISVLDLPAVAFGERRQLPDTPAVYFVLDNTDAVLYIGQSVSPVRRWIAHHRTQQLAGIGANRIAWLSVSDPALLTEIEQACIEHFRPRLNGTVQDPIDVGFYRLSLRIPLELKAQLDDVRTEEERSLHEQIIWCLRQCMKQAKRGRK